MTTKTLRTLAKDYANGVLDTSSYRAARDELLRDIINGTVTVAAIEYRAPVKTPDLDTTMERVSASEVTAIQVTPVKKPAPAAKPAASPRSTPGPAASPRTTISPSGQTWLITGIALATICLALITVMLVTTESTEAPLSPAATLPESVVAPEPLTPGTTAGQNLIENFLKQNSWSDARLQDFLNQWNALDVTEQMDGLVSPQRTQLTNAIHRQLLEERALMGLGDSERVVARQQALVDFATRLGINDPRLKVQEAAGTVPAEQAAPASEGSPETTPLPAEPVNQEVNENSRTELSCQAALTEPACLWILPVA